MAALNHPNIVALFDVGENYFVTELVDGESLRTAQLPPRRVIEVAAQIADGLAAAHAVGISHRDIKPDNVMLTRDGRAKILDFGLARHSAPGPNDATQTLPGTVMGTIGYMSPEQVRGEEADYRSDIFSFGVMLYEMLAGKRAFTGDTAAEMMTAILKSDPPELAVSPQLREIVRHCMEKDPSARFQSAKDLSFALRASGIAGEPGAAQPKPSRLPYLIAAAAALAAFAAGWAIKWDKPVDVSNYRVIPIASESVPERNPAWSPDGKSIAFSAGNDLYVRRLDSGVANKILSGAGGNSSPFWSSAGDRIYYFRAGGIWSVAILGGTPKQEIEGYRVASIAPNGETVAAARPGEIAIGRLGSTAWTPITAPPFQGFFNIGTLRFSPDGQKLVAQVAPTNAPGAGELWLIPLPLGGAAPRRLFPKEDRSSEVAGFSWMPDSKRVVVAVARSGNHGIYIGDIDSGELRKLTSGLDDLINPDVSPDGKRIAFERDTSDADLVEFNLDGSDYRPLLSTARTEESGRWMPNGREFVYLTDSNGIPEPWIRNAEDGRARPLMEKFSDALPERRLRFLDVAPDGERLTIASNGVEHVAWVLRLRGGKAVRIDPENSDHHNPRWSPDGNWIAFNRIRPAAQLLKAPAGGGSPEVIKGDLQGRSGNLAASGAVLGGVGGGGAAGWSPNGKWIAALGSKVLLVSPDGKEKKELANRRDGLAFSIDSARLYTFRTEPAQRKVVIESIDIATGVAKDIGSIALERFTTLRDLSLHPDGKHFLATLTKNRSDIVMLEGF